MQNLHDCRDRTQEFFTTLATYQKQNTTSTSTSTSTSTATASSATSTSHTSRPYHSKSNLLDVDLSAPTTRSQIQHHIAHQSQFTIAAKSISQGIAHVASKLERLGNLAKQKSLFNDSSSEIAELTYVVKSDIQQLTGEIDQLEEHVRSEQHKLGPNHQAAEATHQMVNSLKTKLGNTTKEFAQVLQTRTQTLKEQNTRRKQFGQTSSTLPVRKRIDNPLADLLDAPSENGEQLQHEQKHGGGEQGQLLLEAPQEDNYLESRAQAVESIESTIRELGGMYQRLVNIIGEQQEIAIRIDQNMDLTLENVESGHNELMKYYRGLENNKWLILKIFAILIVFAVFFIVFVA